MDIRTDRRTDIPSYRDARTHLKKGAVFLLWAYTTSNLHCATSFRDVLWWFVTPANREKGTPMIRRVHHHFALILHASMIKRIINTIWKLTIDEAKRQQCIDYTRPELVNYSFLADGEKDIHMFCSRLDEDHAFDAFFLSLKKATHLRLRFFFMFARATYFFEIFLFSLFQKKEKKLTAWRILTLETESKG